MKSEACGKEREEAVSYHGVVEDLLLSTVSRGIAIFELASDGAVSDGDCDAAG